MKTQMVVGDTWDFTTTVSLFPPADGFTLKYRLAPKVSGAAITFSASTEGDHYRVQLAPATTATYPAGDYGWTSWVEKSGAQYSVDSGQVTLLPNPTTIAAGYDNRSFARITLEAIEAVIGNRATKDQQEYAIFGRSLKRIPISELLVFRDRFAAEVANEDAAKAVAAGLGNPRNIGVRFVRP
jgi:hypothetical protein